MRHKMEDYLLKICEEYVENLKSSIKDIEAEAPSLYKLFYSNKSEEQSEQVRGFLKPHLVTIFETDYDLILHKLLEDPIYHRYFNSFLCESKSLRLDLSKKDNSGNTLLINFVNHYFPQMKKQGRKLHWYNIYDLVKNGYKIQTNDEVFSESIFHEILGSYEKEKKWVKLRTLIKTKDLMKYRFIEDNDKLCYLVSIQRKKNFGLGFSKLSNSLHHAFTYHTDIGDVLLKAIRHYGLEEKVLLEDEKGVFQKLHNKFIEEQPEQNEELEALIYELYPELENETKAYT